MTSINHRSTDRKIAVVAVLVLLAHASLSAITPIPGFGSRVVYVITGIALTAFLPGSLVLSLTKPAERLGQILLYAVTLSLVLSMAMGAIIYTILNAPMTLTYLLTIIPALFLWVRDDTWQIPIQNPVSKPILIVGLISITGIVGGYAVHISASNVLAILFLCLLPLGIVLLHIGSDSRYPIGLWFLSTGLLYLNSLLTPTLSTGDTKIEYYYAHLTALHGWEVSFTPLMAGMLRVSVLHPLQASMSGIPLLWEFKIVHPFLVSLIPVGLYYVYREFFSTSTSLYGACLFLLLSPFFTVLSRNTRTGVAMLFAVMLLILIATNRENISTRATILIPVFVTGLVVSHYGTALLFGALLAVAGVGSLLVANIRNDRTRPRTIIYTALLIISIGVMWYSQVASGHIFRFISGIAFLQVAPQILDVIMGGGSSRAVESATGDFSSVTYGLLRIEYILLAGLMAAGFWINILRHRLPQYITPPVSVNTDRDYLVMALVAGGLIASGFLPGLPIGLERVYLLGVLIISPLAIVSAQSVFKNRESGLKFMSVIFLAMIIINGGVLGAVFVERSPQPELIHDEIQKSGSNGDLFHLYARHSLQNDKRSSTWLVEHMSGDSVVYGSGATSWESHFAYSAYSTNRPPGPYQGIGRSVTNKSGYVYTSSFNSKTGVVFPKKWPDTFSYSNMEKQQLSEYRLEECSAIYDSGYPRVHFC